MGNTLNQHDPILIIDVEERVINAIDMTLRMAGISNIITCQDGRKAMDIFSENAVSVVLLDLTMPNISGETLLGAIKHEHPDVPVIIVTGVLDIDTAVRCMKAGAIDYVIKPVEEERLITAVSRAISFRELKKENLALKEHILTDKLENPTSFDCIVTNNKDMLSIFRYIESISKTSQPVLITGETGVGKELVAKAVHLSSGFTGEFVAVNVAGVDDNIFSDTLFGHLKGAFTGAERDRNGFIDKAAGGTLFLDEIGDLSPQSQVKLLRLLQEGEFHPLGSDTPKRTDARIVVATNKDLWEMEKNGEYRKDLIYRLRTHHVKLPPLRKRLDDVPLLADHFLETAAKALKKKKPTTPPELSVLLCTYSFPGNVRELESMIFDAVSRHKSKILSLDAIRGRIRETVGNMDGSDESIDANDLSSTSEDNISFSRKLPTLKQAAEFLVKEAMKRAGGNQTIAAGMLGISHQALSKRIKTMGYNKQKN